VAPKTRDRRLGLYPRAKFLQIPKASSMTAWADLLHSSTMSTEQQEQQQEQSAEERIGSMIGKIIVLALVAFLLWGYTTTLLAQLGLL